MNTTVSFGLAKHLKEKGFDKECKHFYDKYGNVNSLIPYGKYVHLYSNSGAIEHYFTGEHDWNSLDVDEGMIGLVTGFGESDDYINCDCSAPIIIDVVMWIYKKFKIWISVDMVFTEYKTGFWYCIRQSKADDAAIDSEEYNTIEDAYSAAIIKVLKEII